MFIVVSAMIVWNKTPLNMTKMKKTIIHTHFFVCVFVYNIVSNNNVVSRVDK